MMITMNALCNDRPVRVDDGSFYVAYWGSAYLCCDACRSIADARYSWGEVYA